MILNKLKEYLLLILVILLISLSIFCYFLKRNLNKVTDERDDLQEVSKETFKSYLDQNGKTHGTVGPEFLNSQKIFQEQVEKYNKDYLSVLDTKIKKLEGFRLQTFKSEYYMETRLRDTTINDTVAIKIFESDPKEKYYSFKGEIRGDSIKASLKSIDTLVTGISRGKCQNRILWGLIGISKRPCIIETVNKNPYTKITYQKEVYLKKK